MAHGGTVVLLDTSGSMSLPVGEQRRIDVLIDIIGRLMTPVIPGVRFVAFHSVAWELDGATYRALQPGGGTALADALTMVAPWRPASVVIISDGEPDEPEAALVAARALRCRLATYYCGDEENHAAKAFLRALSWCSEDGLGQTRVTDLLAPAEVANELRLALDR